MDLWNDYHITTLTAEERNAIYSHEKTTEILNSMFPITLNDHLVAGNNYAKVYIQTEDPFGCRVPTEFPIHLVLPRKVFNNKCYEGTAYTVGDLYVLRLLELGRKKRVLSDTTYFYIKGKPYKKKMNLGTSALVIARTESLHQFELAEEKALV